MDINRLQYFMVLSQSQSLREASDLLGLTPPALSKAMKVLEEEMGVNLWMRDGRRSVLTDKGKQLVKEAPRVLESLSGLRESLQKSEKRVQPLRIGTFEVFSTYFLSFISELKWNDQPLDFHELLPGEIEKYLIEGEIDVGISYMPIANSQLDFLKVTSIEMGVFVRREAFKNIQQPDIPFVVPIMPLQGVPTKTRGLDGWPEQAYERSVKYRVTLMESALELCRQGRVAGYFPSFVVNEHNKMVKPEFQLVRRKFPGAKNSCYTDAFIIKRKSSQETRTIKQLARALRSVTK